MSSQKPAIAGLVITFNEADRIADCLRSMLPVCQQLLVIDASSTDGTAEIARSVGAEVHVCDWSGFTRQRNIALERAAHPWSLFLDADERLSDELVEGIFRVFANSPQARAQRNRIDGFEMRFRTHFLGGPLRFSVPGRERHVRLFRSTLRYHQRLVHEAVNIDRSRIDRLPGYVWHNTARDYTHYQRKLIRYAELRAAERVAAGHRSSMVRAASSSSLYWLKYYLLRGGFLDGHAGYLYHRLHAEYVFMKHALVWQHQMRTRIAAEHGTVQVTLGHQQ
jgi:(heptosyl)LPS beta-1,4-glucosyltransferase